MNIEDYRDYCLSLGADVEEKLPFTAFRYAADVLVFYVCGHMFAFLDIDHYGIVTLKCQPERIDELKARYDAEEDLLKDLTRNSYEIVKAKYTKKK